MNLFRILIVVALMCVGQQAQAGGFLSGLLLGRALQPRAVVIDRGFRDFDDCGQRAVVLDRGCNQRQVIVRQSRPRAVRVVRAGCR